MKKVKWGFIIFFIAILVMVGFLFVGIISLFTGVDLDRLGGNTAEIDIKGVISVERGTSVLGEEGASSNEIIELIKKANDNSNIKAILFNINSPGGSAVASDEIANAIKYSNKTTVAVIREVGASGGYWIASACDYIVANRMSVTGSIGVVSSYLDFSGFLEDHNVSYERLVAGKYKDMGTPFRELTDEERELYQMKLDKIHDYFINEVAENRGLEVSEVKEMAEGMIYLGSEAQENGLVDYLGGRNEALWIIESEINETAQVVKYEREKSFFDALAGVLNERTFWMGKGISSNFEEKGNVIWT